MSVGDVVMVQGLVFQLTPAAQYPGDGVQSGAAGRHRHGALNKLQGRAPTVDPWTAPGAPRWRIEFGVHFGRERRCGCIEFADVRASPTTRTAVARCCSTASRSSSRAGRRSPSSALGGRASPPSCDCSTVSTTRRPGASPSTGRIYAKWTSTRCAVCWVWSRRTWFSSMKPSV